MFALSIIAKFHFPPIIDKHSAFFSWILPVLLYSVNLIYVIIAGIFIRDRRRNIFPVSIPFLR